MLYSGLWHNLLDKTIGASMLDIYYIFLKFNVIQTIKFNQYVNNCSNYITFSNDHLRK